MKKENSTDDVNKICKFIPCGRPKRCNGYCNGHYQQLRLGKVLAILKSDLEKIPKAKCMFPNCSLVHYAKGYCQTHYAQYWRGEEVRKFKPSREKTFCAFPECGAQTVGFGYCAGHYQQYKVGKRLSPLVPLFSDEEKRLVWDALDAGGICNVSGCESRVNSMRPIRNSPGVYLCKVHVSHFCLLGIDIDEYFTLMSITECQSCGVQSSRMVVDHDHSCKDHSKKKMCRKCIRGRLCSECNTALGMMREDPDRILSLSSYARGIIRDKEIDG